MLMQTLKIVSYLIFSLLIGVVVTLLTDKIDNVAVEKRIFKTIENDIKNSVSSFKESASRITSRDEKAFVKKFIASVMKDRVAVYERSSGMPPQARARERFLFTLENPAYILDFYVREKYLKSELAILDVRDYLSGITAIIIVFTFLVFYNENKKRTLTMQQQFEMKNAELSSALQQNEALALLGRMSATLAHELKTPIATMSNLVQTFPSRQSDEQFARRFMALMHDELNRTQQLIDNLLAYGKEIDIRNGEWLAIEPFLGKAVSNGLLLDLPRKFMVFGDKFYLELLFKNLFRNSREAGADKISVRLNIPLRDEKSRAEIICEDNGSGFSRTSDIEKLTEAFVTSRSRGSGLGLYLAKKIAKAHGGTLSLARIEKGARVIVAVPRNRIKI